MSVGWAINSALIIVAAATFFGRSPVRGIGLSFFRGVTNQRSER